uniref:PKHD1 ciliary IPT domain containing fibrocystin/polyductin n=1 Tax=Sphenodon punctatus TaxID=8508 RepID=A0A8D0HLS2_SPHPU
MLTFSLLNVSSADLPPDIVKYNGTHDWFSFMLSLALVHAFCFAVASAGLIIKPKEGSIGGGTWITLRFDGKCRRLSLLYSTNGSQLEVSLVNPILPMVLCDVSPVYFDLSVVRCQTRYSTVHCWRALETSVKHSTKTKNIFFQFSMAQTPVVYQVYPPSGVPGKGSSFLNGDHVDWVSMSIVSLCRSVVQKDAWLISAKQELFLYQTYAEILSVFPVSGSLGGGTDLTIRGDLFDKPVQVTVSGIPCTIKHLSPQKIICTTGSVNKTTRDSAPQAGNRGLLFEVWDGLTKASPGYRWQFVPNASSPLDLLPRTQQSFRYARLSGFFVAPQTNNYTFWIQADDRASLYLSLSEDPGNKVEVASLPAGTSEWLQHWESNWSQSWQPKSRKFELIGGVQYYLEALHYGKAPSSGMRVGVQLHNTWLNPEVVNTYRRERHEILAKAVRLPQIQVSVRSVILCLKVSMMLDTACVFWKFGCSDLWRECVNSSEFLSELHAKSPVFVHQINLPYPGREVEISDWFFIDEIIISDRDVIIFQRDQRPAHPGGNVIESVAVTGSPPTYHVSLLGSEEGNCLTVSSRDARVNLTVKRVQAASPPLAGTFRILLPNAVISDIPVHISAHHLRELLQSNTDNFTAQYFNLTDFSVSKSLSTCYQSVWTLTWTSQIGDLPNIINVSAENLTGLNPSVTARGVYDGGVFIGPIFGDMLATSNNFTQVVVVVNDILANCSGSCTFQYRREATPFVNDVDYSIGNDDGLHILISITGSGFTEDSQALQIEVNQTACEVITSNQTSAVCQMKKLAVGLYRIALLVRPFGFALNASSGDGIYLRVKPRLTSIKPPTASEIGGRSVILTGTNFEGTSLVLFGVQPCPVNTNSSNTMKIECRLPSRGEEDYIVNVTLASGHQSTVFIKVFRYDPSLNPAIVSLSRNRSSIAGGQLLQIGIASLANYTGLDVEVKIQDSVAQIQVQTAHGVDVTLPPLGYGLYNLSVMLNGILIRSNGLELIIQYATEIFSIEPCCGSFLGGTMLTISGIGFSTNPAMASVLISSQICAIVGLREEMIWCQTPPAARLSEGGSEDLPAQVEVVIGNSSVASTFVLSFQKKNFSFTYQTLLTPTVTDVKVEMRDNSLWLGIEGRDVTDSLAMLGDARCELEFQYSSDTTTHSLCTLPLGTMEPGRYPVRVLQKQVGYANITAVLQHFMLTPQIVTVFVSHNLACGGPLLTISGLALKSQRDAVSVSLTGNYTCEIQTSDYNIINCVLLPREPLLADGWLPNVSHAVNVTVTVNGINSSCLGDCTFYVLEKQWTPEIDTVTLEINGTLIYLLIGIQRLAWAPNELVIKVDNHAPCNVTYWNESSIGCQTDSLLPGEHTISVLGRRNEQGCSGKNSRVFSVIPDVLKFYPQNFSTNGGGLLTVEGTALKGRNWTSVIIGSHLCLLTDVDSVALRCVVPMGSGITAVGIEVDGISYRVGDISYSKEFTPIFLSLLPPVSRLLTIMACRIRNVEDVYVSIGDSPCTSVTGNGTALHCLLPQLPAGEYPVTGGDLQTGQASSNLTLTFHLSVKSVHGCYGCLDGGAVRIHGTGFSPGNTSVTICGASCAILDDATTTDVSCQAQPLNASLAVLCALTHSLEEASRATYIQCDIRVTAGPYTVIGSTPYVYLCDASIDDTPFNLPSRFSPKVERDEVLIYNSSCNITMETEAEMECQGPNQPITAKITEIRKNRGQNTQSRLLFCGLWSKNSSWLHGRPPQDGDNVTVEEDQTLLLDTSTSILNLLHVKGGKLLFVDSGPVELHAHYILVSDGGELRIGSPDKPFCGKARIHLYGSSHSPAFFPYGAKFLAVRNGTLSMHGCVPEVVFTHLKIAAYINDTKLVLEELVDWQPGDEVLVGGTDFGDAQRQEEIVTIKTVNNTELYITSPLRYSFVWDQGLALRAVVALLSRRVVIQGNLTRERKLHLVQCAEAGISGGEKCLYKRSEKTLGSQEMGAVVIVQAFQGERSLLQLEGVGFRYVGQAFRKHLSALTVAGNAKMTDSYVHGCSVSDSFARGLSLSRISDLRVDNNIFYNILGHGLLIDGDLELNRITHNAVIGLSGTDGLSNIETLAPAGVYILAPANWIAGNTVSAAGYGYFFHLSPVGPLHPPLLSFSQNVAHSCTRYGLFIYPEYHPQSTNCWHPVLFQSFTAWKNKGGVQILSSSNLQLQNFQISSCKDFGIDIVESLGNTSVVDSLLLGHLSEKGGSCMLVGLKTPKRFELLVSNTTFVNFSVDPCTAIGTCSGCYRGQGGFTVRGEELTFHRSPSWVSFPFPHSAVFKDLDGSLTREVGSHLLAAVDNLAASCGTSPNVSRAARGSVCGREVTFHRMSIGLKEAPDYPYDLSVTDSNKKTTTVNYVSDTLSNVYGWMALLLDQETYTLTFGNSLYSATFDNFGAGNYLLVEHENLPPFVDVTVTCETRPGHSLESLPSHGHNKSCDWFYNSKSGKLTYLGEPPGVGQCDSPVSIRPGVPVLLSCCLSPPPPILKWSQPESWNGVKKGWGGYNHTLPALGEDVIILPNRTILVDMTLPPIRGLYVLGTLEFPPNSSNVLKAACVVVAGGELKMGTSRHPLERGVKLLILLRAAEVVYCDRLDGINVHPGTIGVYGKVEMHSAYPSKSWTRLGGDIAPGNERILVEDEVDWRRGENIVISSSSYDAHQAEAVTLKEVNGQSIRIHERLLHRHIGHFHHIEDGRRIPLAAEVGLLTRNIQIKSDTACSGRVVIVRFRNVNGREYAGVLQISNVEFLNFGPAQLPSIEFSNMSTGSFIVSSSIHHSCGGGIQALASSGLSLRDNVVFSTVGHGINLEGQNHSLIRNLIVLSKQPDGLSSWVAGIKANLIDGAYLLGNVVAGSERIAFHIKGQECFLAEKLYTDNVAHSSLHGIHLYTGDGFQNCTKITGFLAYKNYDYGFMFHLASSVEVENMMLVDNTIGLLPVVCGPSAEQKYIEFRNSIIIATSSAFDCINDRIRPLSAGFTSRDRAPLNPWKGRVGILWPSFTSEPSQWPHNPWHKVGNYPAVLGIMKLKDVTFASFMTSCHSDDKDICIMSNPDNTGILHPVTAERTRMIRGFLISNCKSSRKALFKDLDGSALSLEPPVSVFPKSDFEWAQSCLDTGIYKEDKKCTYESTARGYFCKETDHAVVTLESFDTNLNLRNLSPVVSVTSNFVDTFSDAVLCTSCCPSQHRSIFYSVLPSNKHTKVCFAGQVPQTLRLYLSGGQNTTKLFLAIFYDEPHSLHVFMKGNYIPPASSKPSSKNAVGGTNYFSFDDNLLYVLLHGDEPIEVNKVLSVHTAFTIAENIGEEGQAQIVYHFTDFLQIGQDQVRIVHNTSGSESTLKAISDNAFKRRHLCPTVTSCTTSLNRTGQQKALSSHLSLQSRQPSHADISLRVLILEISDPLFILRRTLVSSLSSEKLKNLAKTLINAQQTGNIGCLNVSMNDLVCLLSRSLTPGRCLYVRPYTISVRTQPSDGETEKPLPVQPQIVFLDKQSVPTLGPPSEPWIVTASLKGYSDTTLKGLALFAHTEIWGESPHRAGSSEKG